MADLTFLYVRVVRSDSPSCACWRCRSANRLFMLKTIRENCGERVERRAIVLQRADLHVWPPSNPLSLARVTAAFKSVSFETPCSVCLLSRLSRSSRTLQRLLASSTNFFCSARFTQASQTLPAGKKLELSSLDISASERIRDVRRENGIEGLELNVDEAAALNRVTVRFKQRPTVRDSSFVSSRRDESIDFALLSSQTQQRECRISWNLSRLD